MPEFVTLDHFGAANNHYHIYRIQSTSLDHQVHYHNYYQVCFVVSGEILHRQGNDTVSLSAGDAFIVPPGFVHSLHFNNARSEMYSLSFEESLFPPGFSQSGAYRFLAGLQTRSSAWDGNSVRLRVPLDTNHCRSISSLMDCLIRQKEDAVPPELTAAPSLVSAIVYLLAQSYFQLPQNADRVSELSSYAPGLMWCVEYIDQHYKDAISLSELSKCFGLSRSSFCAVFPQLTGMTLQKYIAHKRITEAQMLIRSHPERALAVIAAEVGYEDSSTFYRNFLRITGVSPSQYRQLCTPKK